MEMTNYASKGVANAGLATGIIGTSLGALNAIGGLGALSGVVGGRTNDNCINEDHCVNRYELNMARENDRAIVEKTSLSHRRILNLHLPVQRRTPVKKSSVFTSKLRKR
jgi:hypothetical protein